MQVISCDRCTLKGKLNIDGTPICESCQNPKLRGDNENDKS